MLMLTIETFLLLLLAGLLGLAVGRLCACGSGCGVDWSDDRPWLRDGRVMPGAPTLPAAPTLLAAEERARLAASLAEAKSAATAPAAAATVDTDAAKAAADAAAKKASDDAAAAKAAADAAAKKASDDAAAAKAAADAAAKKASDDAAAAKAAAEAAAKKASDDAAAAKAGDGAAASDEAERAAAADAVGIRPAAIAAPLAGKADELTLIKGIGPQNEKKLHGIGVYHFAQIADWSPENAAWAGSFMAFPGRIEREDWIGQAKRLASGSTAAAPAAAAGLPPEMAAAAITPTVAPEDAERAAAADAVGTRPMALAAAMGGKADDLKRIRGIGPANEKKLNGLGVYHFSQIAAWTAENARWAGSFMAFPGRIEREEWIAQAKVLATGAETEFSKRVDAGEVPTSKPGA